MTTPMRHAATTALQGHRAGFVSRLVADAVDLGVVWAIGLAALRFAGIVRYLLAGPPFRPPMLPGWLVSAAGGAIAVGYLTAGWSSTGRTVGKQLAGLRVVDRRGRRLTVRRALLRAVPGPAARKSPAAGEEPLSRQPDHAGRQVDERSALTRGKGRHMAHLVVLGLDNREDAERVFDLAGDLAKQELLQLEDAAYAYRDAKGKVRIQQAVSLTKAGAASGALWGTLIGLIFLMPVAGMAIGAGSGALAGKLADVGINDDTIKQIGAQLEQGKAAVFLLARSATVDRVIEAIKPYNPTVIQTNLSHDREEELVRALQP
jgi:uncharacterized membrane protein/uncharacterized RDD family membrane protein YckC